MRGREPSALVFDLDGTLIDSSVDIANSCNAALAAHGLATRDTDDIRSFIGDGSLQLVQRASGVALGSPMLDDVHRYFLQHYERHPITATTWLPGVEQALESLRGLPLCVFTNKPTPIALAILDQLNAAARFRVIVGASDGLALKPSPDGLLLIAQRLKVSPQGLVMIGDGRQDIAAGRAAEATTIGVLTGQASRREMLALSPDAILNHLGELRTALTQFRHGS